LSATVSKVGPTCIQHLVLVNNLLQKVNNHVGLVSLCGGKGGQERLGPSHFFISLVLGPLNSLHSPMRPLAGVSTVV